MRLTTKATLFITVILLLLTGVQFYIQKSILYPGFAQIENESAHRNMQRCQDAIEREVYHLNLLATDWSNWDDTYRYVEDHNPTFIEANMTDESFENSRLNLIYIFNSDREVVYHRLYNVNGADSNAPSPDDAPLLAAVHDRILSLRESFFSGENISGLTNAEPFPLALASCSILTSSQEGPSHGRLVMGRYLSEQMLYELSKQTHITFDLTAIDQIRSKKEFVLKALEEKSDFIEFASDSQLNSYSVYPDLSGQPAFLIEANQTRQITQAGKSTIGYALIPTLSILACSLFILLYLVDYYFIAPINDFADQLKLIRRTRDFHERVTVPKEPEINRLAHEFNRLMRRLSLYYQKRNIAEEKLQEAVRQADYANRSKSMFLANMSHEIRTPMNAILGFSELLWEEELTEAQQEYVKTIRTSGQSLLELINDILDLSKIEAGKLVIERAECVLKEQVEAIGSLMEPLARQKHLEFRINVVPDCPVTLHTDPLRLKQCLINLVGNAIKFTTRGHVYVNVYTEHGHDGRFVCLAVEDTGIGIAQDRQSAIFDAFTQSDASTTRQFGGTGLGLTITKKLVEMMQGQLSLQSEPHKGSVFTVRLPLHDEPVPAAASARSAS